MAALDNALSIYAAGYAGHVPGTGIIREDLGNLLYVVTPSDTPFFNWAPKRIAEGVVHEWPHDTLPVGAVTGFAEGAAFNADSITVPARIANWTQIFRRDVAVTRSAQKARVAGIPNLFNREVFKGTKAVGIALEKRVFGNKSVAVTTTDYGGAPTFGTVYPTTAVRRMKGLPEFVTTYQEAAQTLELNQVDGHVLNSASPLTPDLLDQAIEAAYNNGANDSLFLFCSAGSKVDLSSQIRTSGTGASTVATQRDLTRFLMDMEERKAVRRFDVYEGDLGQVAIIASRRIPQTAVTTTGDGYLSGAAWVLDRTQVALASYDPFHYEQYGKTADVKEMGVVIGEWTLEVGAPETGSCIYGLNT